MMIKLYSLYAFLCFLWGTTWFAIKVSLNEGMPPFLGAGLVLAGALLINIPTSASKRIDKIQS